MGCDLHDPPEVIHVPSPTTQYVQNSDNSEPLLQGQDQNNTVQCGGVRGIPGPDPTTSVRDNASPGRVQVFVGRCVLLLRLQDEAGACYKPAPSWSTSYLNIPDSPCIRLQAPVLGH